MRDAVSCLSRANLQRPNAGSIGWGEQYEATNTLRRCVVHHAAQLGPELKAAVVALVPVCDNLRSSLAKASSNGMVEKMRTNCCRRLVKSAVGISSRLASANPADG